MQNADEPSDRLISQTTDLRDELLEAAEKLEEYVNALHAEIFRLKRIAAEDRRQREETKNDRPDVT